MKPDPFKGLLTTPARPEDDKRIYVKLGGQKPIEIRGLADDTDAVTCAQCGARTYLHEAVRYHYGASSPPIEFCTCVACWEKGRQEGKLTVIVAGDQIEFYFGGK